MQQILHIDLDAFFVSVERVLDSSLVGKPVVVGGDPQGRGVVACASYEARKYGLRAGMPLAQAFRLCPHAIYLRGNFDRYLEVSQRFMAILEEYSPFIQPMGIDEAYLDMTGFESLYGPIDGIARVIKSRIKEELKVTASVGIASSRVVAKVASDACKPDGLLEVLPGEEASFLAPLPVRELPGVGEKTEKVLLPLGIKIVGDLASTHPATLRRLFGAWGDLLHLWALGEDDSPVQPPGPARSISRETTFAQDTRDTPFLKSTLRYLAEQVGAELRKEGKMARCVVLKLRYADFHTISRHSTLKCPSDADEAIYLSGLGLMQKELAKETRKVRLIGIGVADMVHPEGQLSLFNEPRSQKLIQTIDGLREKYGYTSIQRGLTYTLHEEFPVEHGRYLLKTACLSR